MTPQTQLEIKGNFLSHPFAELLAEIACAGLYGSLHISHKEQKCVIYVKDGRVVFAVSNARSSRLFDILLRRKRLTKADLAQIPNYTNDLELADNLVEKKILSEGESEHIFAEQIQSILVDALSWTDGEWSFSSLKRVRDGLSFEINATRLMFDYGRCMNPETVLGRFRSLDETFHRSAANPDLILTPDEAFILSRIDETPITIADLAKIAAMPDGDALHLVYVLWLAGMVVRDDWQPAFSSKILDAIRASKIALKREAKLHGMPEPAVVKVAAETPGKTAKEPVVELSLDEYLTRVENAATYYDALGIDTKANVTDIKRAYFGLARLFHPDRFHAEGGDVLQRVQNAFTIIAHAHETLKGAETRELYDYKMRKELVDREKRLSDATSGDPGSKIEMAIENFEQGFRLLVEGDHEAATPLLARAVYFAPNNARYHAYHGKALSFDELHRHKAESEMQTAIRLEPNESTFRVILAEFYVQFNLLKRAEGELTRLLSLFPNNQEARKLLQKLKA
jgi:Flp pilus assembly protein TadD